MTRSLPLFLLSVFVFASGAVPWAQDSQPNPVASKAEVNAGTSPPAEPASDTKSDAKKVQRRIPATLMFTVDELNDIQSRMASVSQVDDDGEASKGDGIENASLYLSTIVYYGPTDWTVWVNGIPIGPGQDDKSFKITDIGPRYVELLVPRSAQGMRPVRLEPNQTFIAKSGAIVEGAWR